MALFLYQSIALPVLDSSQEPEQVTESRWHQPWADPRQTIFGKVSRGYAVALIASGMVIDPTILNTPEQVTESRWHQEWTQPARTRLDQRMRLPAYLAAPAFTISPTASESEPVVEDKWHQPWSEPQQLKVKLGAAKLHAAYQQAATVDPYALTQAEDATNEAKWHQGWSQPYLTTTARSRVALIASGGVIDPTALTQPEELDESKWHQPWSEPIRLDLRAARLKAAYQQAATIDPYALTQAEAVLESKWHQPWSEPRRSKYERYLATPAQQFFEFEPEPPDLETVEWYQPLSEPVRLKPRLITGAQPAFVIGAPPIVSFSWYHPLGEPVREKPKKYLAVYEQHFFEFEPEPPELEVEAWFNWLSEPQRQKVGLRKDMQPTTVGSPFPFGTAFARGYVIT